jgi:hypothetical protein
LFTPPAGSPPVLGTVGDPRTFGVGIDVGF